MNDAPTMRATGHPVSGPTTSAERITSLDLIRGVAILGILPMNALVSTSSAPLWLSTVRPRDFRPCLLRVSRAVESGSYRRVQW